MSNCRSVLRVLAVAGLMMVSARGQGAEPPDLGGLLSRTGGGMQFWGDELFFHKWRIQRNALTGHYRLLDGQDRRHAWGSFAQCRKTLDEIRRQRRLPPMRGRAVIVLHGLFRTRSSMDKLCKYLEGQGEYTVFNVGYPSTRSDVGGHAQMLARIIDTLEGIEEINFVSHSMGNIVVRHYLADQTDPPNGRRPDPRLKRFVMLAPPNHGSLAALTLAENQLLEGITGDVVRQLGQDWAKLEDKLATPAFEFGIIAGGKGDEKGYNPLLPGDDDAAVSVASTRLAGARDFAVVPVLHSFIISDAKVHQYTLRFLQKGYFVSAEQRRPVTAQ